MDSCIGGFMGRHSGGDPVIDGILLGLTTVLTLYNLSLVLVGCAVGTIIGMLPGLGLFWLKGR